MTNLTDNERDVLKRCLFNMEFAAIGLCPTEFLDDEPPRRTIESTSRGKSLWIAIRDLKELLEQETE